MTVIERRESEVRARIQADLASAASRGDHVGVGVARLAASALDHQGAVEDLRQIASIAGLRNGRLDAERVTALAAIHAVASKWGQ